MSSNSVKVATFVVRIEFVSLAANSVLSVEAKASTPIVDSFDTLVVMVGLAADTAMNSLTPCVVVRASECFL